MNIEVVSSGPAGMGMRELVVRDSSGSFCITYPETKRSEVGKIVHRNAQAELDIQALSGIGGVYVRSSP